MSFSSQVKEELTSLALGKSCCQLSELAALTQTSGSLSFAGGGRFSITYRVEGAALAKRVFLLLRRVTGGSPRFHTVQYARLGGQRSYVVRLDETDTRRLMTALHMLELDENGAERLRYAVPRHPLTRQCCRRAYLRGAYLGAGTMNNPERGYHLEWVAANQNLKTSLTRVLEKIDLHPHSYQRRGAEVLYLKSAQQVADVLAMMGAHRAVLALENTRVTHQTRLQATRASNCDEHNSERQLTAAQAQLEAIRLLEEAGRLEALPEEVRAVAEARRAHPEEPLAALGQAMDPPLGKSGVNHRMRRLMEAAKLLQEGIP